MEGEEGRRRKGGKDAEGNFIFLLSVYSNFFWVCVAEKKRGEGGEKKNSLGRGLYGDPPGTCCAFLLVLGNWQSKKRGGGGRKRDSQGKRSSRTHLEFLAKVGIKPVWEEGGRKGGAFDFTDR